MLPCKGSVDEKLYSDQGYGPRRVTRPVVVVVVVVGVV